MGIADHDPQWNDGEHEWGPVEYGRMTGNPHRKCKWCQAVTLDLDDDDAEEE